jgi:Tfp pilus assembly protein PilF
MGNFASLLSRRNEHVAAERMYRAALSPHRRVFGDSHPNTLLLHNNLAFCLMRQERVREASAIYEKTAPLMRLVLGSEHPDTKEYARDAKRCRLLAQQ